MGAAKARSKKLGGYRERTEGKKLSNPTAATEANEKAADAFAANVGPIMLQMKTNGSSLMQIAAQMADKGVRTARGGAWTLTAVRNALVVSESGMM